MLLSARGHTAQRSEQHRPGSFAPLTFAQALPFCKISNASSNTQATIVRPAFSRSCLPRWKRRIQFKFVIDTRNYHPPHHNPYITSPHAALAMLRQLQALPNHCKLIATGPGCDFSFWFIFLLREKKKNIH